MSDLDAIIAVEGVQAAMYLQHRGDGTVWCKWTDGTFVEVVRKIDLVMVRNEIEMRPHAQEWHELHDEIERLRAVLEKLTNGYKYSTEVVTIAREALGEREGK